MADVEVTAPGFGTARTEASRHAPARVATPSASASASSETPRRRGTVRASLVTLRPRQWIKNTLVIAAAGAAGALGHDDVPLRVGLAFVAFCMLASGIYAINDAHDAAEDRLHPRKRFRPVAAGELEPRAAIALGVGLILAGMIVCVAIRPLLLAVGAGYVALTLSYTLVWRYLPVLDIVAIAGGFVLRALAGGVAAPVALSRWFVLVVSFVAIFVAAGKRMAEVRRTDKAARATGVATRGRRAVLDEYTTGRLWTILIGSAVLGLVAYGVWAFELPDVRGIPWRPLTIFPFAAGVLRYGILIADGRGEAPEELVLRDPALLASGIVWLVLFALGVHAAG